MSGAYAISVHLFTWSLSILQVEYIANVYLMYDYYDRDTPSSLLENFNTFKAFEYDIALSKKRKNDKKDKIKSFLNSFHYFTHKQDTYLRLMLW